MKKMFSCVSHEETIQLILCFTLLSHFHDYDIFNANINVPVKNLHSMHVWTTLMDKTVAAILLRMSLWKRKELHWLLFQSIKIRL